MDNIAALIYSFSPTEYKQLEKFMEYKNSFKDRKDKQLLKILSEDSELSGDDTVRLLYNIPKEASIPNNKRNSYHQWRSILSEQIEDFALQQVKEDDSSLYIVKLILIARFLLLRKRFKPGYRYLQKAEEIALKIERYELLHRIYAIQIEYAWSQPDLAFNDLVNKWRTNLELEHKETFVNTALGVVRKQLKDASVKGLNIDIDELVNNVMHEYKIDADIKQNANTRYRMAMIVQISLEEKQDYANMFSYLQNTYQSMIDDGVFNKHNQRLKTKLLTHIFRAAVHNKQYETGLLYHELLKKENESFPDSALLNIRSLMVEYVLMVCTNKLPEAKEFIHNLETDPVIKANLNNDYCFSTLYANLISSNYMMDDLRATQKYMAILLNNEKRLRQHNGFEGVLAANLIDCMINIDRQEYDYVIARLRAIQKRFNEFLKQSENSRYLTFIGLLKEMAFKIEVVKSPQFQKQVSNFIESKKIQIGNNYEFIPFNIYLTAKIKNQKFYSAFMDVLSVN